LGQVGQSLEDPLTSARQLVGEVEIVLYTRGAEGAYLFARGLALHGIVPLTPDEVKNTVGCGDALLGGFVAAVARQQDLPKAFEEGLACAAASACSLGPANVKPALVAELRAKVKIEDLPAK
jgi:fructose-1-phosphate kinase PfkB-like protein